MEILKLVLIIAPTLKTINYSEEADMIIYVINTSDEDWRGNLMQIKQNEKQWHTIWYESGIWFDVEKCYDTGKWKCCNILKILKKCHDYLYEVHFVLKLNMNILIA